jgi:cell division protein FtsI (penicillin-binding protein 3)
VIAPETAIKMPQMMEGVVLHGTGKKATLRGYTSGGKTGSAQIYDFKTHAYTHSYNASFLGMAPIANPQIVIAVTLIGTTGGSAGFGGPAAAPVFHDVASSALRMLDVPKDVPDTTVAKVNKKEKENDNDLAIAGLGLAPTDPLELRDGVPAGSAPALMAHNGLTPVRPGFAESTRGAATVRAVSGTTSESAHDGSSVRSQAVSSVTPPPVQGGSTASRNSDASVDSSLDRRPFFSAAEHGPKVPDFRGMTLRSVLEESAAAGMPVEVLGEGLARNQDPQPGSVLPRGTRVRVLFTR